MSSPLRLFLIGPEQMTLDLDYTRPPPKGQPVTTTKYPPFERITAGRLREGDRLFVRNRADDALELAGQDSVPWAQRARIAAGEHCVVKISTELRAGHRRSSRYYSIELADGSRLYVSSVQRLNRLAEVSS